MAPRKFSENEALSTVLDEIRYTEALLSADDNCSDLTVSFTKFAELIKTILT